MAAVFNLSSFEYKFCVHGLNRRCQKNLIYFMQFLKFSILNNPTLLYSASDVWLSIIILGKSKLIVFVSIRQFESISKQHFSLTVIFSCLSLNISLLSYENYPKQIKTFPLEIKPSFLFRFFTHRKILNVCSKFRKACYSGKTVYSSETHMRQGKYIKGEQDTLFVLH